MSCNGRVEVNKLAKSLGHKVGNCGDDVPTKAVSNKNHVTEFFSLNQVRNVAYERIHIDRGT